jgi:hypothetical protein
MVCAGRRRLLRLIPNQCGASVTFRVEKSGQFWTLECITKLFKRASAAYTTWLSVKTRVRISVDIVGSLPPNERFDSVRFGSVRCGVERTDRLASRLDNLPTRKNEAEVVRTRRRRNLAAKSKRSKLLDERMGLGMVSSVRAAFGEKINPLADDV